ncbi:unnamed protein product [Closterium sp. NIES-64]|nr:unnamed protein product [Closterium sp. NIES-64]
MACTDLQLAARCLTSCMHHSTIHHLFKYAGLSVKNYLVAEGLTLSGIVAILCPLLPLSTPLSASCPSAPPLSYLVAEGLALSGIVAILFCGILMKRYTFPNLSELMKRYTFPNLSEVAQVLSAGFFQLIASIAETFTFIYMGTRIALGGAPAVGAHQLHLLLHREAANVFPCTHLINLFLLRTLYPSSAPSLLPPPHFFNPIRSANVFPCAHLINLFRPPSKQIPDSHQKALWFSGLRGAMAFGLALQATHDLPNHSHGRAIFTTTTAIVMLTVILLGGSTSTVLERLRVTGDRYSQLRQPDDTSDEEEEEGTIPFEDHKSNPSFEDLDSKYIRPFFTAEPAPDTRRKEGAGADRAGERDRGGGVGGGVGGVGGGVGGGRSPQITSPQRRGASGVGSGGATPAAAGGLSGSLLERRSSFRSGSPTTRSTQGGSGEAGGLRGVGGGGITESNLPAKEG